MLAAILRGKLSREIEGLEDVMTSVAFGALQRLPAAQGLCRVLACAEGPEKPRWWPAISRVEMIYWPWCAGSAAFDGAEPDVVLHVTAPGLPTQVLVVECKRGSGKSGTGARDQLARQIDTITIPRGAELAGLIYVTTDFRRPEAELEASQLALSRSAARAHTPMWWLSWRDLTPVLVAASEDPAVHEALRPIAHEAALCLKRWKMERFGGIEAVSTAPPYQFRINGHTGSLSVAPAHSSGGGER